MLLPLTLRRDRSCAARDVGEAKECPREAKECPLVAKSGCQNLELETS